MTPGPAGINDEHDLPAQPRRRPPIQAEKCGAEIARVSGPWPWPAAAFRWGNAGRKPLGLENVHEVREATRVFTNLVHNL